MTNINMIAGEEVKTGDAVYTDEKTGKVFKSTHKEVPVTSVRNDAKEGETVTFKVG